MCQRACVSSHHCSGSSTCYRSSRGRNTNLVAASVLRSLQTLDLGIQPLSRLGLASAVAAGAFVCLRSLRGSAHGTDDDDLADIARASGLGELVLRSFT